MGIVSLELLFTVSGSYSRHNSQSAIVKRLLFLGLPPEHLPKSVKNSFDYFGVTGTFVVGDTLTKGSGNTTTATVFAVEILSGTLLLMLVPLSMDLDQNLLMVILLLQLVVDGTVSTGGVGSANDGYYTESRTTESLFKGVDLNVFNEEHIVLMLQILPWW